VAHEFHVDGEGRWLSLLTSGSLTLEEAEEIAEDAGRLCRKHGLKNVLVELDLSVDGVDDLAFYRVARIWADFARGKVRTAFVKGKHPDLDRYFANAINEQGAASELFETRAEAELWLARDAAPAGPPDGA